MPTTPQQESQQEQPCAGKLYVVNKNPIWGRVRNGNFKKEGRWKGPVAVAISRNDIVLVLESNQIVTRHPDTHKLSYKYRIEFLAPTGRVYEAHFHGKSNCWQDYLNETK